MIKSRLSRLARRGTNKLLSLIPKNLETEGLPDDISFKQLDTLCLSCLNDSLQSVTYTHLSGWKSSNTYRLKLVCKHGSKWNLIYKNAAYGENIIPALADFPFKPGQAEYVVYSSPVLMIKEYLPEVYICDEVVTGKQYFYLIEDLSPNYRPANKRSDVLNAANVLSEIYKRSGDILLKIDSALLPRYDDDFSSQLERYALTNLERYLSLYSSNHVEQVCGFWDKITAFYKRKKDFKHLSSFVHGDPNVSNILVYRQDENKLKFIDWEWAGIGLPHQDLASLLKRSTSSIELEALKIFSDSNNLLSFREHKELYEICQIERGIIDASFLAVQKINANGDTKMDVEGYIEDSASRVLKAIDRLT